jgi:hypothetical protein
MANSLMERCLLGGGLAGLKEGDSYFLLGEGDLVSFNSSSIDCSIGFLVSS